MFRRRVRRRAGESESPQPSHTTLRARSASELTVDVQHRSGGPYNQGLSVSHDSVFTPDTSTDIRRGRTTPPALGLTSVSVNMAELKAVLRRRRRDDSGSADDDPGLPRSPPTSPTTLDVLTHGLKSCSRATHSTCSDASLLSMGSSENDEDSLGGASHHSSRASLLDQRHTVIDREPVAGAAPLSHQAALHKIAIRPKRTHGAPRMRKSAQIGGQSSLPTTPEVNEEANAKIIITSAKAPISTVSPVSTASVPSVKDNEIKFAQEQKNIVEGYELEVKEKEEKKEEPLLHRLFGSVRTGRRRSRGDDNSRESSVSPLRRSGDQRPLQERKRDSSGSRFSVLGRSSSKSRNEPHHPPTGGARDSGREYLQKKSSPPQAPRSSSVEGRLESTSPNLQSSFQLTSYENRIPRPSQGVRKVKSFREVGGHTEVHREPVHRQVSSQSNTEERICVSSKIARLSASFESLDNDSDLKSTNNASSSGTSSTEILSTSPHRSSTDSLTTTQIPGIFIRQQAESQHKTAVKKYQEQSKESSYFQQGDESNSGPLSLDSCISLQTRETDEQIRKTSSVDHVSYVLNSQQSREPEAQPFKASASHAHVSGEIVLETKADIQTVSPNQAQHSLMIQVEEIRTRKQSLGESEGEVDQTSKKVPVLRKEPSLKRLPPLDSSPNPVPEFMRIQLNRVENKGQSVIYDTEQEKVYKNEIKERERAKSMTDSYEFVRETTFINTSASESSHNTTVHKNDVLKEAKSSSLGKRANGQNNKGIELDGPQSVEIQEVSDTDTRGEESSADNTIERVILRKPLVSERAPVMERASSVAVPNVPSRSEQPELFKVFARRSFKAKDIDKDKTEVDEKEFHAAEVASEVSEVTIVPTRASCSSPGPETASSWPSSSVSLIAGHQKPNLNAISFNRKSVGNPALSFCPPPMSNVDASESSQMSPKPTVLVLSNDSTLQTSTDSSNTSNSLRSTGVPTSPGMNTSISSTTRNITSVNTSTTTAPIHGPTLRSVSAVPVSDAEITVITSTNSVVSKIITSKGIKEVASDVNSLSAIKTSVTTRSGPSHVWPPRGQSQDENQPAVHMPHSSQPNMLNPPQKNIIRSRSSSLANDSEETQPADKHKLKEEPVEVTPLDIGAARRRFMSGGKDRLQPPTTPPVQNIVLISSSSTPSPPASFPNKSPVSQGIEGRSIGPSFTVSVRTQSLSPNVQAESSTTPTSNGNTIEDASLSSPANSNSGKVGHAAVQQAAEDWRVLVRQRREGRLKQSKTPETEEILIETRPPVARNSKVLEMANNFQKLQVA